MIPKNRDGLSRLSKMEERHKALVGHLMYVAQLVAKQGEQLWRLLAPPFEVADLVFFFAKPVFASLNIS